MNSVSATRFPFVVTGANAQRIDTASIAFDLRMHLGVAIDLASARLQDPGPTAFCRTQHVDGTEHAGLDCLDWIELVVPGCRGTGQVVDLVDLQKDRQGDIMANQFKIRLAQQVGDIGLLAREEIIEADHVVPGRDQSLAEMRTQESGTAGHKNTLDHVLWPLRLGDWRR